MIYVGADHRGFELKGQILQWLANRRYEFEDMGAFVNDSSDDYVDFAIEVAHKVVESPERNQGIVICGSGVGVSVVANKVVGVRCGLGFEPDQIHAARKDDDINVLALASDNLGWEKVIKILEQFLETGFVRSEKYVRRIEKIERMEKQ